MFSEREASSLERRRGGGHLDVFVKGDGLALRRRCARGRGRGGASRVGRGRPVWNFSSVAAGGAGRCGAPVSNGAPPLLGGPWASKMRPLSEPWHPRRRLARDLQVEEVLLNSEP